MQKDLINTTENGFSEILAIDDSYAAETAYYVKFCQDNNYGLVDGLKPYAEFLAGGYINKAGGKAAYSAAAYNKRLNAAKNRIRYLLRRSSTLTREQRLALEEILDETKGRKIDNPGPDKSKFLTRTEVMMLLEGCSNNRIRLIIQFLVTTGVRISEALNLLNSDIKCRGKMCDIRILGKGSKQRVVAHHRAFIDEIRAEFQGTDYLFEHQGNQYNRQSITRRISDEAQRILNKRISAHCLRHTWAMLKRDEGQPIEGISHWLGHASVSTTVNFYMNRRLEKNEGILDLTEVEPVTVDEETVLLDKLEAELHPDAVIQELKKSHKK